MEAMTTRGWAKGGDTNPRPPGGSRNPAAKAAKAAGTTGRPLAGGEVGRQHPDEEDDPDGDAGHGDGKDDFLGHVPHGYVVSEVDCRQVDPPQGKLRHREPRSGMAIQKTFHWIASSATASSQ
jgi:hypothetical protein